MALPTANPPTTPAAQVVGNAFVEQYYHILHNSPELVHRFYEDTSVLSRPDSNGMMTSVMTMQGINEKVLSLNFKDFKIEIKTADAQKSYEEGVTVLVTGCLTGKDNLRRKFAQLFFLAPQDGGYFVLNDVFRYVEDGEPLEKHLINGNDDSPAVPFTPKPVPIYVSDPPPDPTNSHVIEGQNVVENAYETSDHGKQLLNKEVVVEPSSHSNGNDVPQAAELASSSAQDGAPKESYASIVKVTKGSSGSTKVYVPTNTVKVAPKKTENQSFESAVSAADPEPSVPNNTDSHESRNTQEEVEGHSIYIRNLPFSVTVEQLEVEFKKFGPIKQGGIQVRNNKQQGYCFGFIEFQSLSSMNSAIQASPITIGGRQAVVEIKRTATRVGTDSGRGRFPSGRGGFRNDNFRGRGNFGGGRGFGRSEYVNRGDFSGREGTLFGRGDDYQQGRVVSGSLFS
ncbi:ras GTPase-activating protein-binding protein 2-like [Quillaja saponaria]|uniref:Ras GTPase-activating protein-binding protein 2-like n=1 Tax=Quillaja saponaria TaxID=32244 RepID=A0AAD7PXN4_QUISA|nr:ras GTPase-activating protein-binding protein 2-like [Quillaja saponaria]KAJ7971073.1 ras GTPase-activating protein-binding protein 2-like [Quillaja saponaria]